MSRKWERMVTKNQKTVNVARKKQGIASIQQTAKAKDADTVIKGRSWMLPSLLIMFAVMYFLTYSYGEGPRDAVYWITGISYIALGVLIFLFRRPVIKLGRTYITLRRFTGDKRMEPKDIESLTLNNGHIVIQLKEKKKKYIYTRMQYRFPMDVLNASLREFANQHKVAVIDETK